MGLAPKLFLMFIASTSIEIFMAIIMSYRSAKYLMAVFLVNLITQPTLNYILYIADHFSSVKIGFHEICVLEMAVVLIEWQLLLYVQKGKTLEMLTLSLSMNVTSYLAGFLPFALSE